jgi:hypothetical protein
MAISDYIPNVFATSNPMYEGLLGAEDAAALSQRSNVAGLLGAAAALATGMGSQGPRRSALQNVLGALAAGYGTSGQAYQAGIEQMANAQKLAQARLESARLTQAQQAVDALIKDPRISSDPLKVAYIRANPSEALKLYSETLPLDVAAQKLKTTTTAQPQATAPQAAPADSQDIASQYIQQAQSAGAPVTVTAPAGRGQQLVAQRDQLVNTINVYSAPEFIANKRAQDIVAAARESLKTINTELGRSAVEGYDWSAIESTVPSVFKQRVLNLKQLAEAGEIDPKELANRVDAIGKDAVEYVTKKQDYTNQDRRVAAGMFEGRAIESLNPIELMQLENKLYEMRITEKKAGATTINMPTESERTAGFLTSRLQGSLSQLKAVTGQAPSAASPNIGAEAVKLLTGSDYLKNLANPETRQQVEAAQLELLDAALTLGTGAAYTREQLENYQKSYFPQLGDKPGTIKDKANRLNKLLESAQIKAGRAAPQERPAFDIDAAIKQELERRKGKK